MALFTGVSPIRRSCREEASPTIRMMTRLLCLRHCRICRNLREADSPFEHGVTGRDWNWSSFRRRCSAGTGKARLLRSSFMTALGWFCWDARPSRFRRLQSCELGGLFHRFRWSSAPGLLSRLPGRERSRWTCSEAWPQASPRRTSNWSVVPPRCR